MIEGLPSPEGRTMLEKRAWAMKRLDHLRQSIMLEPRGHTDMYGALLVTVGSRKIPVDIAFGGAFYAIVDAEAAGVPIDAEHLPELRRLGMVIAREVEKLRRVVHPSDPGLEGIYGTI